jgi:predicted lipid-binding transport protein (Tim44 family)
MSAITHLTLQIAAAGGGSSGFGGGGGGFSGGGGGGGFSGGGGGGVYAGGGASAGFVLVVVFVVVALVLFSVFSTWLAARRIRRMREQRAARVRLASVEAAKDDPAFAAETVEGGCAALFRDIQAAWDTNDTARLAGLVGDDLMVEWRRRLDDFKRKGWRNRVRVIDGPEVHYVGLVNREQDADDRAVVHVSATLEDYVQTSSGGRLMRTGDNDAVTGLSEYWTLVKRDGRWILASIEQDAEGAHNLQAAIVTSPWDDSRVRDAALVEGAVADAALPGTRTADLIDVDLSADARAQALDLSLVDARFAPDVLEVAARRAAEGWAEAVDGEDDALLAVAEPQAVDALLYGGDSSHRTRLVVRGPRVEGLRIDRIDASTEPARMHVAVSVRGRRYIEDRDTAAVVGGSREREASFTERWTLALTGSEESPWRLVGVA